MGSEQSERDVEWPGRLYEFQRRRAEAQMTQPDISDSVGTMRGEIAVLLYLLLVLALTAAAIGVASLLPGWGIPVCILAGGGLAGAGLTWFFHRV